MMVSGCAMTMEPPKPLPSLMEQFETRYYINARNITVENNYDPLRDPKDVSSTFPTPPDIAVKQYLEKKFRPAGPVGDFRFVIHDASVYKTELNPDNKMAQWMGVGKATEYRAQIRVGLYRDSAMAGMAGAPGSEIKAERTVSIPAGVSLDQRDQYIQNFMMRLLADLDVAITSSLTNTLMLSAPEPSPSPGAWPVEPVQIAPIVRDSP
jgi:hypothetical protein